jgi:hypothetical protein
MRFPLNFVPSQSWHAGALRFGSNRSGGRRKHAGCDLYAPIGTPVSAVTDGTVKGFAAFYMGTFALTIDHGAFWIRYGEISRNIASGLAPGDRVREGDQIGDVGDLLGLNLSMVHFEMYSGAGSGPLTVPSRAPFMRRSDLIDPTTYLDGWAEMATPAAAPATRPVLRPGSTGEFVLAWQRSLLGQGHAMSLDGDFGPITEAATREFQRDSDLTADGIVGPATYAAMIESEKD